MEENNIPQSEPVIEAPKVEIYQEPVQSEQKEQKESFLKKFSFFKKAGFPQPIAHVSYSIMKLPQKIIGSLREYKRITMISKKPEYAEISRIAMISTIGMLVMGLLGFIIQLIFQLINGV